MAAHLKRFHGTLVCRGTPVEKHCPNRYTKGSSIQDVSVLLGRGVKNCPKLRDVIYGRPLTPILFSRVYFRQFSVNFDNFWDLILSNIFGNLFSSVSAIFQFCIGKDYRKFPSFAGLYHYAKSPYLNLGFL